MEISPITTSQWRKVVKALAYSFGSGFVTGFGLALAGVLQSGHGDLGLSLLTGLVVAGFTGGVNAIAVTIKQLFTPAE